MRILFGVQGTGNGHVTRCRSLARALQQQGVTVDYLFSGRPGGPWFDMEAFGHYQTRDGLTFHTAAGKVDLWQTVWHNHPWQLWQDIRGLQMADYDRIISDFEPVTAWAGRQQQRPVLGISHQAAFRYAIPRCGDDWLGRQIMQHYAPVSESVGLHWFHFGFPILPPVIDTLTPAGDDGRLLVYLPFESRAAISELFSRFGSLPVVCFHPSVTEPEQQGNLLWLPLGREAFVQVLARCHGVVCNAGFELASEALTLGKQLLVKPLHGQFEQASNALALEMLGLGEVMESLNPQTVRHWLTREAPGRVHYPDVAAGLARWLADGEQEPLGQLMARLWRQVCFPEAVCDRLAELGLENGLNCDLVLNS